jgi:hypothetical protein
VSVALPFFQSEIHRRTKRVFYVVIVLCVGVLCVYFSTNCFLLYIPYAILFIKNDDELCMALTVFIIEEFELPKG